MYFWISRGEMEVNEIIRIALHYICEKQMEIDKSTYLTVIIGQITIYAIVLTFYQFAVSFQGKKANNARMYLGFDLIEYYIKNKLKRINAIICHPVSWALFVLNVLYKPLVNMFSFLLSGESMAVYNFFWYVYVVGFFIFFIYFFYKCTLCIVSLNAVLDINRNANIIKQINQDIKKRKRRNNYNKNSTEVLWDQTRWIQDKIFTDTDLEFRKYAISFLLDILTEYIDKKKNKLDTMEYSRKKLFGGWGYDFGIECQIFREMWDLFLVKNELKHSIGKKLIKLHLVLLELNMNIAQKEGCSDIS